MTNVEGAVAILEAWANDGTAVSFDENGYLSVEGSQAIRTILDALASITRERDEVLEENERLCKDNDVRASCLRDEKLAVSILTRERDAMREALEPFAAIMDCGCTFTEEDLLRGAHDDEDWFRHDGCALKIGHFRRAAYLLNRIK